MDSIDNNKLSLAEKFAAKSSGVDKASEDKTIIGDGKTVNALSASNQSNSNQSTQEAPIKPIDHTDNILKLMIPHFADSRQRALAHKKLIAYFNGK